MPTSSQPRSPDYFWGQLSEELLGADITQPLPGEVVVNNSKDAIKTAEEQGKITQQDAQVLDKTKLEAKDVKVDPVVQNPTLSPELQKLIAGLPEGKELEFGEQPDLDAKKNVEEVKQEAAGVASTKAKNAQDANSQNSTNATATKQGSTKEGQIGPFAGPMERLGYLTGTMKKAVAEWWTKNKVTVIIGLVAGIAGLILANIATGGAIMAALPLLLQIVGAIFTGIGILDMAKHFGKYLSQAFPDKTIAGGAKSLARGLAALTIELIFSLLFGGKALLKSAKKGIKTVAKKGVKGAVKAGAKAARKNAVKGIKNTAQNFKDLGGVAKQGGQALVKNGKLIFKGMKRGALAGAKTLDDIAQKLAKKFRFKKFIFKKSARFIRIYGVFNPPVLITEIQREKINDILENANKEVNTGKGSWKKYIDIDKKSQKEIYDILLENNNANDLKLFFRVEGHHAVPQWMGGPLIPYGDTTKLVGVSRLLHNFDWSGIHNVMSKHWNNSAIVSKHGIPYNTSQDNFKQIFNNLSKADKKELKAELKNILDDTLSCSRFLATTLK